MVWNIKFIRYRENKLIVTKYVQNVCHRYEHKHASAFVNWSSTSSISDCSKPRHRRCRSSSMSWTLVSYTRCWMTDHMAPDMWPPNSPDLKPVDYAIWSVIQLINAAGNILTVHYKDMKCDVSLSLGSVSTLFRWVGHFCHVCVKCFLLFTTVQKL